MTPSDVSKDSIYLAGWKCENGHGYRMRVCDRVAAADAGVENTCPVCNINSWTSFAEKGTTPIIFEVLEE